MGHVAHYKMGAVGQLVAHIERTRENPAQYGNEKINPEKTFMNFVPEQHEGFPVFRFWEQVAEKQGQQRKSSDNALTGVIFTLPQRYLDKPKEWQDQFFRNTYDYLKKKFGVEKDGHSNIYCASVHYDETTPHLHFAFVPVVSRDFERHYKDRHGEERTATVKAGSISSRYVVTKPVLSSLHQELDRYLTEQQRGYTGGILLSDEEKIDRHLMMPAKELKQMPEDYLKEARKISKGLRVKHLINDLETEKKEIDRVRLETKATQEIVAEQKIILEKQIQQTLDREKQADNRFYDLQDKEDTLDREKEDLENEKQTFQIRLGQLQLEQKDLNNQRIELRKSQALHQQELAELREYQEKKPAFDRAVAEWNANRPKRDAIREQVREMKAFIDERPELLTEIKQTRAELEKLEELKSTNLKELKNDDKLKIYRFCQNLSEDSRKNINDEFSKQHENPDKYPDAKFFYDVCFSGKKIYDELQKQQERQKELERLREMKRHEHVMTR